MKRSLCFKVPRRNNRTPLPPPLLSPLPPFSSILYAPLFSHTRYSHRSTKFYSPPKIYRPGISKEDASILCTALGGGHNTDPSPCVGFVDPPSVTIPFQKQHHLWPGVPPLYLSTYSGSKIIKNRKGLFILLTIRVYCVEG